MTNKNHLTGTDRVVEAYDIIKKDEEFDIIVNVQGDEPLLKENIEDCINSLKNNDKAIASNGLSNLKTINDIASHSSVKAAISKIKITLFD